MNNPSDVEPVTVSDILGLDTWNRERSSEELQDFITTRHSRLQDVELF
jgi:hypothetical protein